MKGWAILGNNVRLLGGIGAFGVGLWLIDPRLALIIVGALLAAAAIKKGWHDAEPR